MSLYVKRPDSYYAEEVPKNNIVTGSPFGGWSEKAVLWIRRGALKPVMLVDDVWGYSFQVKDEQEAFSVIARPGLMLLASDSEGFQLLEVSNFHEQFMKQ